MLGDFAFSIATGLITFLASFLPNASQAVPQMDSLAWLSGMLRSGNQFFPLDTLSQCLTAIFGLKMGMVAFDAFQALWKLTPFFGHGAV